ncbi:MAG: shikimate kinase [Algicola sp.]|nr:shikimate kinase [Algicola sp.]
MILILVGYMGSGKSSVGKSLSKILGYDFIDLDAYIEENLQMTISEIFESKGEIFFRKQESSCLKDVLEKQKTVVALGGGTPCYGNNLNILKEADASKIIYLKSSIQNLADRLYSEKSKRPLISHLHSKTELIEFIGKHLFERAPFYEQSDITIKIDTFTIDQIVESILLELF